MTLILWLVVGIVVGILAKRVIPTLDKSNWLFAALIAFFFRQYMSDVKSAETAK